MKNGKENKNQAGFSLLEVMIAMTVFAMFTTAYMTSEGYNLADSSNMKKEILLHTLCEDKINQIILNPPKDFGHSLTLAPETGNFNEEGYPDYTFSVEYKNLVIPDFSKLLNQNSDGGGEGEGGGGGSGGEGDEGGEGSDKGSALRNKLFEVLKSNIEEMLWQVRVTVEEKNSNFPYSLTTLLMNNKAKVKLKF